MKKRLTLTVSLLAIASLIFGANWGARASATVPGVNELVHKDSSGAVANSNVTTGSDVGPRISGDSRYVAFASEATNLVPSDTNGASDVFIKDASTGQISLVSVMPTGSQWTVNAVVRDVSYNGKYVLFSVGTGSTLYVRDTHNSTTTRVCETALGCPALGLASQGGRISADGRYVVWEAVLLGSTNNQIVLTNMQTLHSKIISVDSSGNPGNKRSYLGDISCDGGIMSFYTKATNLPNSYGEYLARFDENGDVQLEHLEYTEPRSSSISCNGNVVVWYSRDFSSYSVKVYNRITGQATMLVNSSGQAVGSVGISNDGRFVAITTAIALDPSYQSPALAGGNDAYVIDLKNNTRQLVTFTVSNARSGQVGNDVDISADGSKVVYYYPTPSNTNPNRELISGVNTGTSNARNDVYISETGF